MCMAEFQHGGIYAVHTYKYNKPLWRKQHSTQRIMFSIASLGAEKNTPCRTLLFNPFKKQVDEVMMDREAYEYPPPWERADHKVSYADLSYCLDVADLGSHAVSINGHEFELYAARFDGPRPTWPGIALNTGSLMLQGRVLAVIEISDPDGYPDGGTGHVGLSDSDVELLKAAFTFVSARKATGIVRERMAASNYVGTDDYVHVADTGTCVSSSIADVSFNTGTMDSLSVDTGHRCANCNAVASEAMHMKRCSACKSVWYCNKDCQNADWRDWHRHECKK
jgi:hypothetical protein